MTSVEEDASYADILSRVKADHALKELSENVTRIWQTRKGGPLFELSEKKKGHDMTRPTKNS